MLDTLGITADNIIRCYILYLTDLDVGSILLSKINKFVHLYIIYVIWVQNVVRQFSFSSLEKEFPFSTRGLQEVYYFGGLALQF